MEILTLRTTIQQSQLFQLFQSNHCHMTFILNSNREGVQSLTQKIIGRREMF